MRREDAVFYREATSMPVSPSPARTKATVLRRVSGIDGTSEAGSKSCWIAVLAVKLARAVYVTGTNDHSNIEAV